MIPIPDESLPSLRVRRTVPLPDAVRVERSLRAPELGPRVLFFSGGTALKGVSRALKHYTHNSIHLITPFDSGGSSAALRDAFGMLSVGDMRNRLIALADETVLGNPEIYRLFSHRLAADGDPLVLGQRLDAMIRGEDPLVAAIPHPLRQIVRTHLRLFARKMAPGFDLRGASIGNLMIAGGYLSNQRDIDSVAFLFSQLLEVRGVVRATTDADLHLAAILRDGRTVVGQKMLTGKEAPPLDSAVDQLFLVPAAHADGRRVEQRIGDHDTALEFAPVTAPISESTHALIASADVIVYPMGSFYSSVVANLLPEGVGRAIAARDCPKVLVPNTAVDPEAAGRTQAELVDSLLHHLRRDAGDVPTDRLLNAILLDVDDRHYDGSLELDASVLQGIDIVRLPLVGRRAPAIGADRLARVLVSLG